MPRSNPLPFLYFETEKSRVRMHGLTFGTSYNSTNLERTQAKKTICSEIEPGNRGAAVLHFKNRSKMLYFNVGLQQVQRGVMLSMWD